MHVRLTESVRVSSRIPAVAAAVATGSLCPGGSSSSFLFPSCCATCGAARRGVGGGGLCRACWQALPFLDGNEACQACALPSAAPLCRSCRGGASPVSQAAAVVRYEGVARRLVHALKFRGHDISSPPPVLSWPQPPARAASTTVPGRSSRSPPPPAETATAATTPEPSWQRKWHGSSVGPSAGSFPESGKRRRSRPYRQPSAAGTVRRFRRAVRTRGRPPPRRRRHDDRRHGLRGRPLPARPAGAMRVDLLVLARTPEAEPMSHAPPEPHELTLRPPRRRHAAVRPEAHRPSVRAPLRRGRHARRRRPHRARALRPRERWRPSTSSARA